MMFPRLSGLSNGLTLLRFKKIYHPEADWVFLDRHTLKQNEINVGYLYATQKRCRIVPNHNKRPLETTIGAAYQLMTANQLPTKPLHVDLES